MNGSQECTILKHRGAASEKVVEACRKDKSEVAAEILSLKQYLVKKSHWVFGGDGWAYDIGTEVSPCSCSRRRYKYPCSGYRSILEYRRSGLQVYSGGAGQNLQLQEEDPQRRSGSDGYELCYVYVAQVAMGANNAQYLKL